MPAALAIDNGVVASTPIDAADALNASRKPDTREVGAGGVGKRLAGGGRLLTFMVRQDTE
jgi:hypothetical protein